MKRTWITLPILLFSSLWAWSEEELVSAEETIGEGIVVAPQETTFFNSLAKPNAWLRAEYLMFWVKDAPIAAPLLVTGSPNDLFPGALDQPGTQVLLQGPISFGRSTGLRFTAGSWLDDQQRLGFEVILMGLEQNRVGQSWQADANGTPYLARPFLNARTGNENVYFVSQNLSGPGVSAQLTGSFGFSTATEFRSLEINGLGVAFAEGNSTATLMLGYRSVWLREDLRITQSTRAIDETARLSFVGDRLGMGESLLVHDAFRTDNQFFGLNLGGRYGWQMDRLSLDFLAKVAVGVTQQLVQSEGATTRYGSMGGLIGSEPGGLLSLSTNGIRNFQTDFSVVPEIGFDVGFRLTSGLKARMGYSMLYWSGVARPGGQIDRTLTTSRVPMDMGYNPNSFATRPSASMVTTDFWTRGFTFMLDLSY